MAVTIGQEGGLKSAADQLAPEFIRYRSLIRQDRRRRYLGWAALAVSVVWLALAVLNFFNLASPSMILAGAGLTLLIPGAALLYEASSRAHSCANRRFARQAARQPPEDDYIGRATRVRR